MPWGDGLPEYSDFPAGAWGDGRPLGPAETPVPPDPPVPPVVVNFIAEILIDEVVIWSGPTDAIQQAVALNVAHYTGLHTLKFRIRGIA